MPGTTAHMKFPYPVDTDPINVAGDIKKLADAVDLPVYNNQTKLSGLFPQYSTVAALKADTTSDFAQVLCSGSNGFVPAWRESAASNAAWIFRRAMEAVRTTDSQGAVYFTAAELGFTTILYAFGTCVWSATANPSTEQLASVRIASNQVQVRVYFLDFGTIGIYASKSANVSVDVIGRA